MTFLGCFPWKHKKRKDSIITVPTPAGTTEEDCGEECISNVPETVAPESLTVDKGKGIAIGDERSKTVTISESDPEVIGCSEVSYDSDRSGPSSYHPRPSRRARSPPTRLPPSPPTRSPPSPPMRLPPCQETACDDCDRPPLSPPSPNNSYCYPTLRYYPQPVYRVPPEVLYPQDEPPAHYQTCLPCYQEEQEQQPEMSWAEKFVEDIFAPPDYNGCRPFSLDHYLSN